MILESFLPIRSSFIVISFVDRADVYLSSFVDRADLYLSSFVDRADVYLSSLPRLFASWSSASFFTGSLVDRNITFGIVCLKSIKT